MRTKILPVRADKIFTRLGTPITLCALAIASWTPGSHVVRTGLTTGISEHVIAYSLASLTIGLFNHKIQPFRIMFLLIAFAAIMEFGQLFTPGRTAQFSDFAASTFGIFFGTVFLYAIKSIYVKLH
jgi:VanZ like family